MSDLNVLADELAVSLYGMTKEEAVKQGICLECKNPALPRCYSEAGRKEYHISGLCEKCYDSYFYIGKEEMGI